MEKVVRELKLWLEENGIDAEDAKISISLADAGAQLAAERALKKEFEPLLVTRLQAKERDARINGISIAFRTNWPVRLYS